MTVLGRGQTIFTGLEVSLWLVLASRPWLASCGLPLGTRFSLPRKQKQKDSNIPERSQLTQSRLRLKLQNRAGEPVAHMAQQALEPSLSACDQVTLASPQVTTECRIFRFNCSVGTL